MTGPRPRPLADRLWPQFDCTGGPSGCWPWTGARNSDGYGLMRIGSHYDGSRRMSVTHRIAWELAHKRPIPPGMNACHKCDNPPCGNPTHLFLGTQRDNLRDAVQKGRPVGRPAGRITDDEAVK